LILYRTDQNFLFNIFKNFNSRILKSFPA
jgi:hypothetical protein